MTEEEFFALGREAQNSLLQGMAENVLGILTEFPSVHAIAEKATSLSRKALNGEFVPAQEISKYLTNPDMDQDLGMQIYNVNDQETAIKAIDIVCYAIGAVSKSEFERQGITKRMPAPVQESVPEVTVEALECYRNLLEQGLVERIY